MRCSEAGAARRALSSTVAAGRLEGRAAAVLGGIGAEAVAMSIGPLAVASAPAR
jgi:hypothetical protein